MDKIAQKRSLLNKLREVTNIGGMAVEKLFNPEFKELMNKLRDEIDDPIRAIMLGESVGTANPPDDPISLRELIRSAKSNYNRREYMKSAADLSRFHKKMHEVVKILESFKSEVDKIHERFLLEGLDDESKKYLSDIKNRMAYSKTNMIKYSFDSPFGDDEKWELTKDVGKKFTDIYTNLFTEKGWGLRNWEKRYPTQIKKLKKDTNNIIETSKRFLGNTLATLKELATARATRNPDRYIQGSSKIINSFNKYNELFKTYYTENIKGFLEKIELNAPTQVDTTNQPTQLAKQPVVVQNAPNTQNVQNILPNSKIPITVDMAPATISGDRPPSHALTNSLPDPSTKVRVPSLETPTLRRPGVINTLPSSDFNVPNSTQRQPTPPSIEQATKKPGSPDSWRDVEWKSQNKYEPAFIKDEPYYDDGEPPTPVFKKEQHRKFFESLKILSQESPQVLSHHIRVYANKIQKDDPITAIKLFKIIQSIGK